jgi:transcription antitermination factor NusG
VALATKGPSRGGARSRTAASIERGTRVRVLEGPFSGKVGTVHELDGKGGARVMLGLLAVRFDVTNLTVHDEGRRRPVLGTSHRKPVPVRS